MQSNLEQVRDSHSGRINIAKYQIHLSPADLNLTHLTPCRVGSKASEFEKEKMEKMFLGRVIEQTLTEWSAPKLFAPKKDGTLRFCIDYRDQALLRSKLFTRYQALTNISTFAAETQSSLSQMRTSGTDGSGSKTRIQSRSPLPHISDIISLCGCLFDYGMMRVRSDKRWMSCFQRLSGSSPYSFSTISSSSLALQRNTSITLNMY